MVNMTRTFRPKMDQTFAKEIKDALIKKDPKHKKEYEKNYKNLTKNLLI